MGGQVDWTPARACAVGQGAQVPPGRVPAGHGTVGDGFTVPVGVTDGVAVSVAPEGPGVGVGEAVGVGVAIGVGSSVTTVEGSGVSTGIGVGVRVGVGPVGEGDGV
jgi:hypothetical protein